MTCALICSLSLLLLVNYMQINVHHFSFLDDPGMIQRIRSTFVGQYSLDKVNCYFTPVYYFMRSFLRRQSSGNGIEKS